MVIIDYPDESCRKFFLFGSLLFGPIDSNGAYRAISIDLPISGSRWEPQKGIFDENNILHSSFDGRVYYYPILADCAPLPSVNYPRTIRVPILESPGYVDAVYGFACPDCGALVRSTSTDMLHIAVKRNESTWTMIQLISYKATPNKCFVYKYELKFNRWISPSSAEIASTYTYGQYAVTTSLDFRYQLAYDQICSVVPLVTKWVNNPTTYASKPVYTTDPSAVKSPGTLAQNLEIFTDNLMQQEFPIPSADYGDLAAKAIKQKRLIDTNLYEFMRDLPHIKDLIPKLTNLGQLKTHANNFLGYEYGILPTVDDISSIVGAFEKRRPFFDKFGFTVFNSSKSVELYKGTTLYTLSQYIKVPVANEDSEFQKLLEELDEIGLGLNLKSGYDLIKYSFAFDWLINVGGFLKRIDNNLRLSRYNIPYSTMSEKQTITGELPQDVGLATLGKIEWRYYHRWVSPKCPLPPLTLSTSPTVASHWLEAGSLIIQRAH